MDRRISTSEQRRGNGADRAPVSLKDFNDYLDNEIARQYGTQNNDTTEQGTQA